MIDYRIKQTAKEKHFQIDVSPGSLCLPEKSD